MHRPSITSPLLLPPRPTPRRLQPKHCETVSRPSHLPTFSPTTRSSAPSATCGVGRRFGPTRERTGWACFGSRSGRQCNLVVRRRHRMAGKERRKSRTRRRGSGRSRRRKISSMRQKARGDCCGPFVSCGARTRSATRTGRRRRPSLTSCHSTGSKVRAMTRALVSRFR